MNLSVFFCIILVIIFSNTECEGNIFCRGFDLISTSILEKGECLCTYNNHKFCFGHDGYLVLDDVKFQQKGPGDHFRLRSDGNMVVYTDNITDKENFDKDLVVWDVYGGISYTNPDPLLKLHSDGELILYRNDGAIIWSKKTTKLDSYHPTKYQTSYPTKYPTDRPTKHPTDRSTKRPTYYQTKIPTDNQTKTPNDLLAKQGTLENCQSLGMDAATIIIAKHTAPFCENNVMEVKDISINDYDQKCVEFSVKFCQATLPTSYDEFIGIVNCSDEISPKLDWETYVPLSKKCRAKVNDIIGKTNR